MSGNYRLTIIDEDGETALEVRFMVLEPSMQVGLEVSTNTDIDVNNSHQQVNMAVSYSGVHVTDPSTQLHTVVMQNGRWDNAIVNARPQYTMSDGLRWEHCRDLIFDAGNEYHKFEVLDTDHPTLGIDVENDRLTDYVMVHFQLNCPSPVEGDVYLNGVWTNDRFLPEYLMEYDEATKSYQAAILLKMGYYSYQYLMVDSEGYTKLMPTEGNFFQTENKYQALVYYREPGGRTDQLVGYQQVQKK